MLALAVVLAGFVAGCGDGGDSTEAAAGDQVEIVDVFYGFEYYGACGNETVVADGTTLYPLYYEEQDAIDQGRYPTEPGLDSLEGDSSEGMVPIQRVIAPGPGDDIGTLLRYADGIARFESKSGRVLWLTEEPRTYDWVC